MEQDIYVVLRGAFPRPVVQLVLHELALLQAKDDDELYAGSVFCVKKIGASCIDSTMSFPRNFSYRYTLPIISNISIIPDAELLPKISLCPQFTSAMFKYYGRMEQSMSRVLRNLPLESIKFGKRQSPANLEQRLVIYKNPTSRKAKAADFGLPSKKEIAKKRRDTWRRK